DGIRDFHVTGVQTCALPISWAGAHAAGRVQRHVQILRDVVHHMSPDPARLDRPCNAAEAETQFWDFLTELQRKTPRVGLSAPSRSEERRVGKAGRYRGLGAY